MNKVLIAICAAMLVFTGCNTKGGSQGMGFLGGLHREGQLPLRIAHRDSPGRSAGFSLTYRLGTRGLIRVTIS